MTRFRRLRTYSELIRLPTFEERFEYLSLRAEVGVQTFGYDRWINQRFYKSSEWLYVRRNIIVRDGGCDLAMPGMDIRADIMVHHLNQISAEDIRDSNPIIFDPENLITTTHKTHNAIHYGDSSSLSQPFVERRPGDTKLW